MSISQDFEVFEPEVWADFVDVHFRKGLLAANHFSNLSGNVTRGGDQIVVPKLDDNFSSNDVQTTSGNISPQSITDTATRIDIDSWKENSLRVSDFQDAQDLQNLNVQGEYIREMAHNLGVDFDKALLDEADQYDSSLGDSTTDLTVTNYRQSVEILASNSVPRSEALAILHPRAYYGDLLTRQKIYDASQFGTDTLRQSAVDNILGVDVVLHENVPTTDTSALQNQMAHRKAVAFGFGNLPAPMDGSPFGTGPTGVRTQKRSGENLRVVLVADIMYGLKVWRSEAGVEILSQNNR